MHNPHEANNSESIHTVHDDVVYFSGEFNCVEFEYAVHVDKVEFACTRHVKGRLKERIAFWQSIGASRWVLGITHRFWETNLDSLGKKRLDKMATRFATKTRLV